jgi:hypothetical protein
MTTLTTKQQIIDAMAKLPDDATFEDAMDVVYLLYKIQRGIGQGEAGQTISHSDVRSQSEAMLRESKQ